MDHLWSPWRHDYITRNSPNDACIFCEKAASKNDDDNFIVWRGKLNFILLNIFPYTGGHVMVAPYQHVPTLEEAGDETLADMMQLARATERHLREIYSAPGFNIGMNIGKSAGAGIASHIHMHVLPRWPGDTNFMTTVSETRVLSESLTTTYEKLKAAFQGSRAT
jgi:ATP adenylyltransferase